MVSLPPDDRFIHPTAIVEDGVSMGKGVRVWHHAHLRAGARLGENVSLGKNVYVDVDVHIGSDTKVQNNVSIYSGVELGDEVFVGPSVVFTNDRVPRAVGSWNIVATKVARGASIGANATIVAGADIGSCALVAAGAVVTKPVRSHEIVAGNPARTKGWVCKCGETRVGPTATSLTCDECATAIQELPTDPEEPS